MTIEILRVTEMSCNHCVQAITKALQALPGVGDVQVSLGQQSVRVAHDDSLQLPAILEALKKAGYRDVSVLA